jgi:hypothetical protein
MVSRASVGESEAEQWRGGTREKELGDESLYWQHANREGPLHVGQWSPAVYNDYRVTMYDVVHARDSDWHEQLNGV